jgi:cytochrome P450
VDLGLKIQYLTLDVISDVGFGETFGHLRTDSDVNANVEAGEIGLIINSLGMALGLTAFLQIPLVWNGLGPSEKDKAGLGKLVSNARAIIESRLKQDTTNRSDMIASFVRHGLNKEELITETCLQILAGSDTTAAALKGITLYLFSNPRVYNKLKAEIAASIKDGGAPPSPAVISDAEARKLPYLQAVIKEGIRIHPPVTDEVPKRVPDEGDTIIVDGKPIFLPGGTYIGHAPLAISRRKEVFGEDVDEFRPERWLLEEDDQKLALMNRSNDIIFGHGKYQCLGKPIALMEINKTIFEVGTSKQLKS